MTLLTHLARKRRGGNTKDIFKEVDEIYDSTDIWNEVFHEIKDQTSYGKWSQKSAVHLAWAIADKAMNVFQKRALPPHLQFIDMFEMEINQVVISAFLHRQPFRVSPVTAARDALCSA
jgi:hypothetical protein